jgi:hypothetical protein
MSEATSAELRQLQQDALVHLLSISARTAPGADAEKSLELRETLETAFDQDEEDAGETQATAKARGYSGPVPDKTGLNAEKPGINEKTEPGASFNKLGDSRAGSTDPRNAGSGTTGSGTKGSDGPGHT